MPRLSIVIPTLNAAKPLEACLQAIRAQAYRDYELIIADAGSTDDTIAIAQRYAADVITSNPLKSGEAGKAAGISVAQGELIALIDSDNILPDPTWLTQMLAPFDDPEILATEPIDYTWRATDPALTRYFALLGMNDPICLFTGNYDRTCAITRRWTELPVVQEDCGAYLKLRLTPQTLPTIGANGFIFRRTLLDGVNWQPYFFDIDILQQRGTSIVAKVKCGIIHLYCNRLRDFARKQNRRICDFLFFAKAKQRTYDWQQQKKSGIILFIIETVTLLPLLLHIMRGSLRKPDIAWFYHIPVCWITLWVYGWATIRSRFCSVQAADRSQWKQ